MIRGVVLLTGVLLLIGDLVADENPWALQPITAPSPPNVKNASWTRAPIDRFVLAQLEKRKLRPVGSVGRAHLIRRLYFDLLGLPPSTDQVRQFLLDKSPTAYIHLVDSLLASPAFGERWGRYWLDVARYADDQLEKEYYYRPLPHAWRYRDWVIQAFNQDLPYDVFVQQQVAGDLLPKRFGPDGKVAVGFLALGLNYQDDGGTPAGLAEAKAQTLDDRVDTVTRGLLALTVSCARCHDHKFDPVSIEDYYSIAGIFQNTKYVESVSLRGPLKTPDKSSDEIKKTKERIEEAFQAGKAQQERDLRRRYFKLLAENSINFPRAHSVKDQSSVDMRVAVRGNLLKPGKPTPRRFLRSLPLKKIPNRFTRGSGRIELAAAIVAKDNPLTARVIVNRVWQHHFGRGLVATPNNFGLLGETPSHPKLLDWLARQLIESGWSLKRLHRTIVLSQTYRLGNQTNDHNNKIDGANRWWWRRERRRLTVESWRDSLLAASGELDRRMGGPAEYELFAQNRRTVYAAVRRDRRVASDKFMVLFDFPNPRITRGKRTRTTIPQQQLFALNSQFMVNRAKALARQIQREVRPDESLVERASWRVFSRGPTLAERQLAKRFFSAPGSEEKSTNKARLTLFEQYCQVLLSSNEFMYSP